MIAELEGRTRCSVNVPIGIWVDLRMISDATGRTIQDLVSTAARREIDMMLRSDEKLSQVVEQMKRYRTGR